MRTGKILVPNGGWFNIIIIIILSLMVIAVVAIALIFRHLIYIKKIKPSKLSRWFYSDDKYFMGYWEKTLEKGKLKYIIKGIVFMCVLLCILSLAQFSMYGNQQILILLFDLVVGALFGFISSQIGWSNCQNRYRKLKEKSNVESDNINNDSNA